MNRITIHRLLLPIALAALGISASELARAQASPSAAAAVEAPQEFADGEVRRIDKAQGKVNLRHGEIRSLEMPPMSMWFVLKDPAWVDGLKVGEKVRFVAEKVGTQYTITRIEPAR
jgi:Cu(I)/Ag(I) efflux system periplasmic protein CusF